MTTEVRPAEFLVLGCVHSGLEARAHVLPSDRLPMMAELL